MAEYIDRIAFREKIDYHYPFDKDSQKDPKYDYAKSVFLRQLAAFPAADVVEQKTGKWVKISSAGIYKCSQCGQTVITADIEAYKFCHGCGAKMEVPADV